MTGLDKYLSIQKLINVGMEKSHAAIFIDEMHHSVKLDYFDTRKAYKRLVRSAVKAQIADVFVEQLFKSRKSLFEINELRA